eukprot:3757743-Rhodomonas_salina.1
MCIRDSPLCLLPCLSGVDLRHDDDIHFAEWTALRILIYWLATVIRACYTGDVTRPLDDVTNAQISAVAAQADVVICAYVSTDQPSPGRKKKLQEKKMKRKNKVRRHRGARMQARVATARNVTTANDK